MGDRLPHAVVERCPHVEIYATHPHSCTMKHIVQLPQCGPKCIAYALYAMTGHASRLAHQKRDASIICRFDFGGPLREEFYQGSVIHET